MSALPTRIYFVGLCCVHGTDVWRTDVLSGLVALFARIGGFLGLHPWLLFMQQHFSIVGTGGYLPDRRISAEELDARLGLEAGWTRRHTGVISRFQRAPGQTATAMGCRA